MKIAHIHLWDTRIFTNNNKAYVNVKASLVDEEGLQEEFNKNIFLTDNTEMPFDDLEILAKQKVDEYKIKIENE
jgi:hypothetical protein